MLGLQLGYPALRLVALLGEVDAAARAAERLGKKEVLVAVEAVEVRPRLLVGLLAWLISASMAGSLSRMPLERCPSCTSRCSSCRQIGFLVDQLTEGAACGGGSWAPGIGSGGGCCPGGAASCCG
ncbi:MAG: hypothetical protein WDN31_19535 [Hyphomicrobium sp.]